MEPRHLRRLVEELLRLQAGGRAGGTGVEAAIGVLEAFHRALRLLVGQVGWEAVLGEAVRRTGRLRLDGDPLTTGTDGPPSASALRDAFAQVSDPDEGVRDLLLEFLAFLTRLVGWRLTLSIVCDLWPDIAESYRAGLFRDDPGSPAPTGP